MAEKIEKLFSSHEYNYFASVHVCKSIAYERIIVFNERENRRRLKKT